MNPNYSCLSPQSLPPSLPNPTCSLLLLSPSATRTHTKFILIPLPRELQSNRTITIINFILKVNYIVLFLKSDFLLFILSLIIYTSMLQGAWFCRCNAPRWPEEDKASHKTGVILCPELFNMGAGN